MSVTRILYFTAPLLFFVFASVSRAEDRTRLVESSINWQMSPFAMGYSCPAAPGSWNEAIYQGVVEMVLERDPACARIDRAFEKSGFRMKRDVIYDRDGVAFRLTGYDEKRKVGYVWGTPETLGDGFFGDSSAVLEKEKGIRLSAAEAKLLVDRAPVSHEFIAVVIPYTNRLGYTGGYYRNEAEKVRLERQGAASAEMRLAAVEEAVDEYVRWVAARLAEEYPAPSPEPRNLLAFARWNTYRAPGHLFGECGVGQPEPLPDELVKKSIASWGAQAKLDLTSPFEYKTKFGNVTITGFDPKRKIGYLWNFPADDDERRNDVKAIAAEMEADGLRIAWISPSDVRFDNAGSPTLTVFAALYAEKAAAIPKIADPTAREAELRKLNEEITQDNFRPTLERLERRVREFFDWAAER